MANLEEQLQKLQHLLAECNEQNRQLQERNARNQDVWNQEDESHRVNIERLNVRVSGQERRLEEVADRENHLRDQLNEAIRIADEGAWNQEQLQGEIQRLEWELTDARALDRMVAAQQENADLHEQIAVQKSLIARLLREGRGVGIAHATPVEELGTVATAVPSLQEATAYAVETEGSSGSRPQSQLPEVPTHAIHVLTPQERGRQDVDRANVAFAARFARPQSPISPQSMGRMGGDRKRRKKKTRKKRKRKKTRRKRKRRRKNTKKKR
jgi:hypothetical protein